jgi:hypothetical protein
MPQGITCDICGELITTHMNLFAAHLHTELGVPDPDDPRRVAGIPAWHHGTAPRRTDHADAAALPGLPGAKRSFFTVRRTVMPHW